MQGLRADARGDLHSLSPREKVVARCAAAGARNKEIAWQLCISEGTVKLHLFHAYRKLQSPTEWGWHSRWAGLARNHDPFFARVFVLIRHGACRALAQGAHNHEACHYRLGCGNPIVVNQHDGCISRV